MASVPSHSGLARILTAVAVAWAIGLLSGAFSSGCSLTAPGDEDLVGSCTDGIRNGDEVDVDCGAECPVCLAGKKCKDNQNCASALCDQGTCREASCSDGTQNGDESDRDCGGSCPGCGNNGFCRTGADCVSVTCTGGRCAAPTCTDGVQNGVEVDVDCGFDDPTCPLCGDGKHCLSPDDCESYVCTNQACVGPSCSDDMLNGDEADVDCGGSCPTKCGAGKYCFEDADCASGSCVDDANLGFVCG